MKGLKYQISKIEQALRDGDENTAAQLTDEMVMGMAQVEQIMPGQRPTQEAFDQAKLKLAAHSQNSALVMNSLHNKPKEVVVAACQLAIVLARLRLGDASVDELESAAKTLRQKDIPSR